MIFSYPRFVASLAVGLALLLPTAALATGNLLHTFDDPTPTSGGEFGSSVALDGNNVLIGAPLGNTNSPFVGQAHLFDLLCSFNFRDCCHLPNFTR